MADVHEEFYFSLAHLLGMDMFLQIQSILLLAFPVLDILVYAQ